MYNLHTKAKQQALLQHQQSKTVAHSTYLQKYKQECRPDMLNNYNKRINAFISKIQEEPIQVGLDPHRAAPAHCRQPRKDAQGPEMRRNSTESSLNETKQTIQRERMRGFTFKSNDDWKSLFTHWERVERQKNYSLFCKKYGNPDIAYRSIGSQSEYRPHHQFRQRNQTLQIHPPMKYTHKSMPIKAFLQAKSKQKKNKLGQSNSHNERQSNKDEPLKRTLTNNSFYGLDEIIVGENNSSIDMEYRGSATETIEHEQFAREKQEQKVRVSQSSQKAHKMHFKQVIDLEQHTTDPVSKKALRNVLYQCGVYRRKNRRATTDVQVDNFLQFEQNSG